MPNEAWPSPEHDAIGRTMSILFNQERSLNEPSCARSSPLGFFIEQDRIRWVEVRNAKSSWEAETWQTTFSQKLVNGSPLKASRSK